VDRRDSLGAQECRSLQQRYAVWWWIDDVQQSRIVGAWKMLKNVQIALILWSNNPMMLHVIGRVGGRHHDDDRQVIVCPRNKLTLRRLHNVLKVQRLQNYFKMGTGLLFLDINNLFAL